MSDAVLATELAARAARAKWAVEDALRPYELERWHASALSLEHFRARCVPSRRPTVIAGLGPQLVAPTGSAWLDACAERRLPIDAHGAPVDCAARATGTMRVRDLAAALDDDDVAAACAGSELCALSIRRHAPELLAQLRVPRYVAHDQLVRTRRAHAWPEPSLTLLLGARGMRSALRRCAWHAHAWCVVVRGEFRWTVFHPDDCALLGPVYAGPSLEPSFPTLRELDAEPHRFPAASRARRCSGRVVGGEFVFVPAGSVYCLEAAGEATLALAYAGVCVDGANHEGVLRELRLASATSDVAAAAYAALAELDDDDDDDARDDSDADANDDADPPVGCALDATAGSDATAVGSSAHAFGVRHALTVSWDEYASGAAAAAPLQPLDAAPACLLGARPRAAPASECERALFSLESRGYAILRAAVPSVEARALRAQLLAQLAHARASDRHTPGDGLSVFSKINDRGNFRHDMRLHLHAGVRRAVRRALGAYGAVYGQLFPAASELVELGAITSQPGAAMQSIHADVRFEPGARRIWTSFLALQDISAEMGPTHIWAGTHHEFFCAFYKRWMKGPVDPYWEAHAPSLMVAQAGDVVLMDTRVTHAGGANASGEARMLLHFSFMTPPSAAEYHAPVGFTNNLAPELRERPVTIATLADEAARELAREWGDGRTADGDEPRVRR